MDNRLIGNKTNDLLSIIYAKGNFRQNNHDILLVPLQFLQITVLLHSNRIHMPVFI